MRLPLLTAVRWRIADHPPAEQRESDQNTMSKKRFEIEETEDGKRWFVVGKGFPLVLEIDHDDVDHDEVEVAADKLLAILEEHWE